MPIYLKCLWSVIGTKFASLLGTRLGAVSTKLPRFEFALSTKPYKQREPGTIKRTYVKGTGKGKRRIAEATQITYDTSTIQSSETKTQTVKNRGKITTKSRMINEGVSLLFVV